MRKKRISQQALHLAILTLITVLVWAGFEIYRAYTKTTVALEVRELLAPLNPNLETELMENFKHQREISLEEIKRFPFKPSEEMKESLREQELIEEIVQQEPKSGQESTAAGEKSATGS
jgi:hypothetical protein